MSYDTPQQRYAKLLTSSSVISPSAAAANVLAFIRLAPSKLVMSGESNRAGRHFHGGKIILCGIFQVRLVETNEADISIAKREILLAGLTAFFLAAGFMLGGEASRMIALVFAIGINFFSYWNSYKLVLRMYGAKPVSASNAPQLHKIVTGLCQRSGMPIPSLYIIENDQPNAFATGRDPENAALAATTGLLRHLNDPEITGVMAHELAHVKNRDTLIMTVTATIAGALPMLANRALFFGGNQRSNPLGMVGTILIMILAPLAAMLV